MRRAIRVRRALHGKAVAVGGWASGVHSQHPLPTPGRPAPPVPRELTTGAATTRPRPAVTDTASSNRAAIPWRRETMTSLITPSNAKRKPSPERDRTDRGGRGITAPPRHPRTRSGSINPPSSSGAEHSPFPDRLDLGKRVDEAAATRPEASPQGGAAKYSTRSPNPCFGRTAPPTSGGVERATDGPVIRRGGRPNQRRRLVDDETPGKLPPASQWAVADERKERTRTTSPPAASMLTRTSPSSRAPRREQPILRSGPSQLDLIRAVA